MSDRERQRELDRLVLRFLAALEDGDFEEVSRIWDLAATDPELETALAEAAIELPALDARESEEQLEEAVRAAWPTVEVVPTSLAPITVAEVAEVPRRRGVPGLSASDLALNDILGQVRGPIPDDLRLSAVMAWGAIHGNARGAYWRALRATALELQARRDSAGHHAMSARPLKKPDPGRGDA